MECLHGRELEPSVVDPGAVPGRLEHGALLAVRYNGPAERARRHRSLRHGRIPLGQGRQLHLVIGQLVLIVDGREQVGLPHLRRRCRLGDHAIERDRVPFGEDADHVLRLPRTGALSAPKDAEVVRPGLNDVPPFAEVAVDEIRTEEVGVRRELGKEALEGLSRELEPSAMDEVESLDGDEGEPVAPGPAVSALLVELQPVASEPNRTRLPLPLHA